MASSGPADFKKRCRSSSSETLVGVGLPADNTMHLPIFDTVLRGIKIVGSLVGTHVDLKETFALHADKRTEIVRETRGLD